MIQESCMTTGSHVEEVTEVKAEVEAMVEETLELVGEGQRLRLR